MGQPRGASTRLQVTNSSPPSGNAAMVCTSPLPRVELPITTPRPRSASAAARISAALAVRPSTTTTTGTSPASSPGLERQIRVASGSRPTVIVTTPAGSSVSAALTAWRSSPPRSPRRSRMMPSGGCAAGEALPDGLREVAVGAAVELGDLDQQRVADALGEDGLRRNHGAFQLRRVRPSVLAAPGNRELRLFRAGDPAHHRGGVLAAGRLAIDRQDRIARPNAGERAGSIGDGLGHHDGRSAPGEAQARACLTNPAFAILAGIARRHVAGIRIEMIEQLVEEALHDALRSGSADRHGRAGSGQGKVRGRVRPAVDVGFGGRWPRRNHDGPARSGEDLPSCRSVVSSGSSAVSPCSPQMVSCETATGSSVRGAMKASAVA